MTAPHPDPDLLLAADEGVLPEEVAAQVKAHLAECAVCTRLKADLLVCAEPSLAAVERVRRRTFETPAGRWRWAAAGLLAASIVAGVLWWRSPDAPRPAQVATVAQPAPKPVAYRLMAEAAPLRLPLATALVLRGQEAPADEAYLRALGEALEPYRAGRWAAAADTLHTLKQRYPQAVEPVFYEGVARLLNGDAAGAKPLLERAQAIGGEALEDDIAWYLAVTTERTQGWMAARTLLSRLCTGDSAYRESACRALATP